MEPRDPTIHRYYRQDPNVGNISHVAVNEVRNAPASKKAPSVIRSTPGYRNITPMIALHWQGMTSY